MMMMTNPITPPPELVRQWIPAGWAHATSTNTFTTLLMPIADNAALWSHDHCKSKIKAATDQELEACLDEIYKGVGLRVIDHVSLRELLCSYLRAARRPKPPSLKEQALAVLMALEIDEPGYEGTYNTIRRALESLPND
jgi:hypothetical protein